MSDLCEEITEQGYNCLLYTSDAADDLLCVDLGGRRIIKKKKPPIPFPPLLTILYFHLFLFYC